MTGRRMCIVFHGYWLLAAQRRQRKHVKLFVARPLACAKARLKRIAFQNFPHPYSFYLPLVLLYALGVIYSTLSRYPTSDRHQRHLHYLDQSHGPF